MTRIWQSLETFSCLSGVPADWRPLLNEEFATFSAAFLRARAKPAASVPCPHGCGCAHDVVHHDDGRMVAVCCCDPWNCDSFAVTPADVVVLELNWAKLARALARAFDCDPKDAELGPRRTRQIGSFSNAALPVVLTIQNGPGRFHDAVAELVAMMQRPFALFAPTTRHIDARSQQMLARCGAAFFAVEAHVNLLPSGVLQARTSGAELFAPLLPAPPEGVKVTEAQRVLGILMKLKSRRAGIKAPLYDVFVLTVLEGRSQRAAAEQCDCSLGQLALRVRELEKEFGLPLERLKAYATPMLEMQTSVKGERRRKRKPGSGPGAFADDEPTEDREDEASQEEYRYEEGAEDG